MSKVFLGFLVSLLASGSLAQAADVISGFSLVNSNNNNTAITGYTALKEGSVINLSTISATDKAYLSIRAITAPNPVAGSVSISLTSGTTVVRSTSERVAPYTITGDPKSSTGVVNASYKPVVLTAGAYTIAASPKTAAGASSGSTLTIHVTVTTGVTATPTPTTTPKPTATPFAVVNASNAYCYKNSVLDDPDYYAAQLFFDVYQRTPTVAELKAQSPVMHAIKTACATNADPYSCLWLGFAKTTNTFIASTEGAKVNGTTVADSDFVKFAYTKYNKAAPTAAQLSAALTAISNKSTDRPTILGNLLVSDANRKLFVWGGKCGWPSIGFNGHPFGTAEYLDVTGVSWNTQISLLKQAKANIYRVNISLAYDVTAQLQKFYTLASANNIELLVDLTPDFSTSQSLTTIYNNSYNDAKALATALRGKVKAYELGNEVDSKTILMDGVARSGSTLADYDSTALDQQAAALRGLNDGIHSADATATTTVDFGWLHAVFLQAMLARNVNFDVVSIHWYQDMSEMTCPGHSLPCSATPTNKSVFDQIKAIAPGKTIWMTEAGYRPIDIKKTPTVTEADQDAKQLAYTFSTLMLHLHNPQTYPIEQTYYYELLSEPSRSATNYTEARYGFVNTVLNANGTYSVASKSRPIMDIMPYIMGLDR